jgi:outer membrane murein-binding lipoprotein Lpp
MSVRRAVAAVLVLATLGVSAIACTSGGSGNGGATTDLGQVGPDIAQLRAEIAQLRAEVQALREALATVTTSTTAPLR